MQAENIEQNAHILDVGCGTGQTAAYLASSYQANVTGLDIQPIMIEKARQRMQKARLPVSLLQGSIEQTSLANESFDLILAESVLAFVNLQLALQEIYRLLKKVAASLPLNSPFPKHFALNLQRTSNNFTAFSLSSQKRIG